MDSPLSVSKAMSREQFVAGKSPALMKKHVLARLKSSPCSTAEVPGRDYDTGRERVSKRLIMRGYSGHIAGGNIVCGTPVIPSMTRQLSGDNILPARIVKMDDNKDGRGLKYPRHVDHKKCVLTSPGKHKLPELYEAAILASNKGGYTQEAMLNQVQCKLSEKATSNADMRIKVKSTFDYFDYEAASALDEFQFNKFLEFINCDFGKDANRSLYALFDKDCTGRVSLERFSELTVLSSPRSGTQVLPKVITSRR